MMRKERHRQPGASRATADAIAWSMVAFLALATWGTFGGTPVTAAAAGLSALQPGPAQDEFVPISELPPEEELAAAPLLVAAYAFVWLAVLAYVYSIWRRLGQVERELAEVARVADTRREKS